MDLCHTSIRKALFDVTARDAATKLVGDLFLTAAVDFSTLRAITYLQKFAIEFRTEQIS